MATAETSQLPVILGAKPSPPTWLSLLARVFSGTLLGLVGQWIHVHLGGVSSDSANPNGIFNWHPILMTLGFGIFMTEAILAYKAPVSCQTLSRPTSKLLHGAFHILACLCIIFGLTAVFRFHNLKGFADLYSPHSFIGLFTVLLVVFQFGGGFFSYLWPKMNPRQRAAYAPLHGFLGLTVWGCGLAAIMTGLQEKTAFVQSALKPPQLFSAIVRLPATAELFVVFLAITVLYIHFAYSGRSGPQLEKYGSDVEGLLVDEALEP